MKEHKGLGSYHWLIVALLAVNVLLTIFVIVRKDPAVQLEELKAGGAENFAMVQELYSSDSYKLQQKATISQFLDSIKGESNLPEEINQEPTNDLANDGTINQTMIDNLNEIKEIGYIQGDKDAQITILEYSDLVCPFCKRQSSQGTVEQVLDKYPGKVNRIFRQFPLVNLHPTAPKGSEAVECAGELGGSEMYYVYLEAAFNLNEVNDDNLIKLSKDLGLNQDKFGTCLQSGKYKEKVDAQLAEGQGFGVSGTPGNLIINSANGKYELVAGAYPVEKFVEVIEKMLAE
ncbi:DsbA family protein [Candidatus Gracilibacteria bacterium]|nr:DsbA family protein [Candidatus Gracilibacteria bacterium]